MTMWLIIMWTAISLWAAAAFYLGTKVPGLIKPELIADWGTFKQFSLGLLITLVFMGFVALCFNFVNSMVCVVYVAMIWGLGDFVLKAINKHWQIPLEQRYLDWGIVAVALFVLIIGWVLAYHVWETKYSISTEKQVTDLRIVMFADAHVGTTFDGKGFAKHVEAMAAAHPDVVVIVGDYVDDGTTKEDMIEASKAFKKLKPRHGIYFVLGNHDKGYYGPAHRGFSEKDLINELGKNGVIVLRDESVSINNYYYIIGRRDYSEVRERGGIRKSMEELTLYLNKHKYMIVLDHQPTDFKAQADAEVDLVLSGHTHGGQLFPFNWVGRWIGANDMTYGHKKRNNTDFIVTSGISSWAIKFKTGTKSEFVVIDIKSKK